VHVCIYEYRRIKASIHTHADSVEGTCLSYNVLVCDLSVACTIAECVLICHTSCKRPSGIMYLASCMGPSGIMHHAWFQALQKVPRAWLLEYTTPPHHHHTTTRVYVCKKLKYGCTVQHEAGAVIAWRAVYHWNVHVLAIYTPQTSVMMYALSDLILDR
jgi:hypothetical protein